MHQAVVVQNPLLEQQLVADRAELPPWRDIADRLTALEPSNQFDTFVEHGLFLDRGHRDRVLVRIAMNADLVAGPGHRLHLLWKRLDRMTGDEPGRLDPEAAEQVQEPRLSDLAREHPPRDITWRVLAAIGP